LALEGFLEEPKTILEGLVLERHSSLVEQRTFHDWKLEA
jgi:hypothetical protein